MVSKADEKWDAIGDNPLVIMSEIRKLWVDELNDFMEDPDFTAVLNLAVKLINQDYPDHDKVAVTMVRLEAYAIKFRTQFGAYMAFKKGTTEANQKKNLYKELYTGIDRLVDALKYMVKT